MSNPVNSATQQESKTPADVEPSIEDKLATAEQRRKDTQAGYTKGQQTIKAQEAEIATLKEQIAARTTVSISTEEQASLDALKYEDPDAWRKQMNALEIKTKGESRANLEELTGEARKAAEHTFELDRRQQVLKEHNESAEVAITDEVIANDVPPRITNKLVEGKITFEEYLENISTYLATGKVVKNEETLEQPNMSGMGGGVTPDGTKAEASAASKYANDLY